MTQRELVKSMYPSNKTRQWMGDRPPTCLDRFKQLCGNWSKSNPGEDIPQQVVNKLWFQAARGEKKGRVRGQGSLYLKFDKVMNPPARDPSPTLTDLSPPTSSDSTNLASRPAPAPSVFPPHPSLPSRAPDLTPLAASQHTNDQTALQRQVDQLKEMFGSRPVYPFDYVMGFFL